MKRPLHGTFMGFMGSCEGRACLKRGQQLECSSWGKLISSSVPGCKLRGVFIKLSTTVAYVQDFFSVKKKSFLLLQVKDIFYMFEFILKKKLFKREYEIFSQISSHVCKFQ